MISFRMFIFLLQRYALVTDLHNLHIDFENLASSETTPTPEEKAEEGTESAVELTYIIINKINTDVDKLADKEEVIGVYDVNQGVDYNAVLARDAVRFWEIAGMVEICLTLLLITF